METDMAETFDFTAFMQRMGNPDAQTTRDMIGAEISDAMETVLGEVCPRVWCVLVEQSRIDPKNLTHLNAVMNSAIFAVLSFLAAMTPTNSTDGMDNDDALRRKIIENLNSCLSNGRDAGNEIVQLAQTAGKMKLMNDTQTDLANVITANSMIIKGIHEHIKKT